MPHAARPLHSWLIFDVRQSPRHTFMKISRFLFACSAVFLACVSSSCSSSISSPARIKSVAVAIVPSDGRKLSPQQLAGVLAVLRDDAAKAGYVLAAQPNSADYVVHVKFIPNPADEASGTLSIIRVEPNLARHGGSNTAQEQARSSAEAAHHRASF